METTEFAQIGQQGRFQGVTGQRGDHLVRQTLAQNPLHAIGNLCG